MPAMTMPYKVQDPALLEGKQPGDLVTATLVVEEVERLSVDADDDRPRAARRRRPPARPSPTSDLLKEGDVVPDHALVDQNGTPRPMASLRGHRVALTFIYTRCPLPDFCPLMDKQFAAVQQEISKTPELADVRLVSVTLDPGVRHARRARAARQDARRRPAPLALRHRRTATRCSPSRSASASSPSLAIASAPVVHNLRTAVIDAEGRLVKAYSGSTWTPAELVADLKAAPAPAH